MKIKFDAGGVLALRIEHEEAQYLWENVHKSEVIDKEYDVLFFYEKVVYNKEGYFDYKYFDREMVAELLFLIRRGNQLMLINNAVGSEIIVSAEAFDQKEFNRLAGSEDFEIMIPAEATNFTGHYEDMLETDYFELQLNKDGISMNVNLNYWKFKEQKNSMKIKKLQVFEDSLPRSRSLTKDKAIKS